MKKTLFFALVALLLSCSSDDEDSIVSMEKLPQKEVSMTYTREELDAIKFDFHSDLYEINYKNKKESDILGHWSIYIQKNKKGVDDKYIYEYRFFDSQCPYCIYKNDLHGGTLKSHSEQGVLNVYRMECYRCGSLFTLKDLKSTEGPAFKKGLNIIEYPATVDANNVYHVTNPNYKRK